MTETTTPSAARPRWSILIGAWIAVGLLYLVFTSNPSLREGVATLLLSTITIAVIARYARTTAPRFNVRWRDVAAVLRWPLDVMTGLGSLLRLLPSLLARPDQTRSTLHHQPYIPSNDEPIDRTRKAALTLATTSTPNSIVIETTDSQIVYHQIKPAELPKLAEKLAQTA